MWATLLYGLVLLAFGIDPVFPPIVAMAGGLLLGVIPLFLIPRWISDARWNRVHAYTLIFGVMTGSMLVSFIAFWGAALSLDLYFKILVDLVAIILLTRMEFRMRTNNLSL